MMDAVRMEISLEFIWIPESLGGHVADPYTGMRLTIRWQRHIDAYLKCARDVECSLDSFDAPTSQGVAICRFASDDPVPAEWLQEGELVELLSGFRVLAVGRIVKKDSL